MESQIPSSIDCVTIFPTIQEFEDFPQFIWSLEERNITFALVNKFRPVTANDIDDNNFGAIVCVSMKMTLKLIFYLDFCFLSIVPPQRISC